MRADVLRITALLRELICKRFPSAKPLPRGELPYHGSTRLLKISYALALLDRIVEEEETLVRKELWEERSFRKIRFVEGILYGLGVVSLSALIEMDEGSES